MGVLQSYDEGRIYGGKPMEAMTPLGLTETKFNESLIPN